MGKTNFIPVRGRICLSYFWRLLYP